MQDNLILPSENTEDINQRFNNNQTGNTKSVMNEASTMHLENTNLSVNDEQAPNNVPYDDESAGHLEHTYRRSNNENTNTNAETLSDRSYTSLVEVNQSEKHDNEKPDSLVLQEVETDEHILNLYRYVYTNPFSKTNNLT